MSAARRSRKKDSAPGLGTRSAPIIERAPLPTIEVQGSTHRVFYVNPAFCRLLGKTREELIGKEFSEIVPGGAQCLPILDSIYLTEQGVTHLSAEDADRGAWLYAMWPALDASARPIGVIVQLAKAPDLQQRATAINEALLIAGLHQHALTEAAEKLNARLAEEIDEHKKTGAALAESESLFRSLYDTLPVAAFVCDRDAVIQSCNRLAVELWGRQPEVGVERHCGSTKMIRMNGSELPHEQSPIVEVLRTGRPVRNVEIFIGRPDGFRLPVLINFAPLKTAQGKVIGAITCFIEITNLKHAEEALRLAMMEIERGSRAKDDFLSALSHELRTPLTPVLMTAAALENDPALTLEVREQLAMMRRNIELEARLIDDLLDLTRISRGKLQIAQSSADLHQLLEYTGEIVRAEGLEKQVRITFLLEAPRHHALADPTRLQQVFWNLIKNAVKFTPSGGAVTVSTRNDAGGSILVSVEDTGIGIGAKALPHIFNAFEQGDIAGQHRYGGLGLGLAIARAIVEAHGGALRVESQGVGRGATFTVALATIDAPALSARSGVPASLPTRGLRLLVVEDHEATRIVLARLLTRSGDHVTTAGTVAGALTAFAAEHFDAVISDVGLPDGSGVDLMREIQRRRPVPGIALSGYGMEEDVQRSKEAGFSAHLVKPVNLVELRLLLEKFVPA